MERSISVPTYVLVCAILIALTVLTVAISFAPLRSFWHMVLGMVIALLKASLVVLFFMHAAISPKQTWLVIIVTGFWFGILVVLTLSDYVSRDLLPSMPGH
jgi:cytochrome c oxidase subunit 4